MIPPPVLIVAVNACGRLARDDHRTMAVRMLVSFVLVDSGWTPELDAIIRREMDGPITKADEGRRERILVEAIAAVRRKHGAGTADMLTIAFR